MNLFPLLIAQAAPPDPMISGNWIIAVIGAVAAGIALVIGKKQGRAEAAESNVTIKPPVPTVRTQEEPAWATRPDLIELIDRTDRQFGEVWEAIQAERGIARTALSRIHERIDAQSNATAKLQGSMDEVKGTLGRLLDIALNRKPPGTRS